MTDIKSDYNNHVERASFQFQNQFNVPCMFKECGVRRGFQGKPLAAKQWAPVRLIISNLCVTADEKLLKRNHLDPLSDTENEVSDFNDETGCKATLRWEFTASHF